MFFNYFEGFSLKCSLKAFLKIIVSFGKNNIQLSPEVGATSD